MEPRIPLTPNDIRVALVIKRLWTSGGKVYAAMLPEHSALSRGRAWEATNALTKAGLLQRQYEGDEDWRGFGSRRVFFTPSQKSEKFLAIIYKGLTLVRLCDTTLDACEALDVKKPTYLRDVCGGSYDQKRTCINRFVRVGFAEEVFSPGRRAKYCLTPSGKRFAKAALQLADLLEE